MSEQTPTPRTDSAKCWADGHTFAYVNVEDCRQLERELTAAVKELDEARNRIGQLNTEVADLNCGRQTLWSMLRKGAKERDELKSENERLAQSIQHTQEWYAVRLQLLEDFFRNEGKGLPVAYQFWNIIANGTNGPLSPPTYQQQMNRLKHENERLAKEVAEHKLLYRNMCQTGDNLADVLNDYKAKLATAREAIIKRHRRGKGT